MPPCSGALPSRASAVAREGRQSAQLLAFSLGKSGNIDTCKKVGMWHFSKVAWSSTELLIPYISKITQFYKLQTKIKAVSLIHFILSE